MRLAPDSLAALQEAVRCVRRCRIVGSGSKRGWASPCDAVELWLDRLSGVVEFSPADQVVVVRAGTRVEELQSALAESGQCLPLPDPVRHGPLAAGLPGTVGGLVSANMPHALSAQHGSPRDWILGATFVRADGSAAKSGSKVVKSVAGFDVHRMAVGAWGRWMVVAEAVFKTWPLRTVAPVEWEAKGDGRASWVARYRPSQLEAAVRESRGIVAVDRQGGTIWSSEPPPASAGWWRGPDGAQAPDPVHEAMRRRLDAALDPGRKFA